MQKRLSDATGGSNDASIHIDDQLQILTSDMPEVAADVNKADRTTKNLKRLQTQIDEHQVRKATFEGKHELVP